VSFVILSGAFIPAFCGWIERDAMKLRVIKTQWNSFIDALRAGSDVETAGMVLAERLHGGEVLLARQMIEVPPEGYLIRRSDQLRLDPISGVQNLNRSITKGQRNQSLRL
jgi:hypothetical protein